jgi:hypothetical protein
MTTVKLTGCIVEEWPQADPHAATSAASRANCPSLTEMRFGVRDSNGHEHRAHGGPALDSHTRLRRICVERGLRL